ncbi:Protein 21.1 [Giardia lamblia P15]|uniref:Protein 21.1 n=1 Tax=Giardia intestinalis (strain P15) TaxID=658858 RepID=E1F5F2_GIAIA|nr:Protein 21.1 [Giardia lamblia P15]
MFQSPSEAAWFHAVAQGDQETVRSLVESFKGYVNIDGDTALIQACRAGNLKMAHILIPYEAGLVSTSGYTALMVAALSNNPGLCEVLAPLEKDITLDDGRDSYMLAAQVGAAAALLMMTKNFKLRQDKARLNALDYAVNSGHLDCVNIILSSQRISNIELKYAINVASENRFLEIERALVSFKNNARRTSNAHAFVPSKHRPSTTQPQTKASTYNTDSSPSPMRTPQQNPLTASQMTTSYVGSVTSSVTDFNDRHGQTMSMLRHKITELTNSMQIKENEIITLQMENMKLQQANYPYCLPTIEPSFTATATSPIGFGTSPAIGNYTLSRLDNESTMLELMERIRHLEDAYALSIQENMSLQHTLQMAQAGQNKHLFDDPYTQEEGQKNADILVYEDLEFVRPSSAKKSRRRSKSVTAMLKDKSRPRTPPMCGPKRSTADPSENVFSRQSRKYLGDLQDAPVSCSMVTTEEFDKIIEEKNNTIAMLQELISEYQSRGINDLQATVGYQEVKVEASVKGRTSNRLSTSSLFGRGKSVRKDAATRSSSSFDAYRKNTIIQLAERDKEIHLLREQLAKVETDGTITPKTLETNKEEIMNKVIAEQAAKLDELQELLDATELHRIQMPVPAAIDSLNDKIKALEHEIEDLLKDNETLKKELSERPQHDDSRLCKLLANSKVGVKGLSESLCASTMEDVVDTISSTRDLISLLADRDAEIERLREVINSMPDLDPGNLDRSQTSPKQIQLLLDELETKTQELDDLKASMGSMGNTMTSSKRSLSLGRLKKKDRSRATTPVTSSKRIPQDLADENLRLTNEVMLLAERVRGLEADNDRLEKLTQELNRRASSPSYNDAANMKKLLEQLKVANERLVVENTHLKERLQRSVTKNAEHERLAFVFNDMKEDSPVPCDVVTRIATPPANSAILDAHDSAYADDGQSSTARLNAILGVQTGTGGLSLPQQVLPSDVLQAKDATITSLQTELVEKNEEIDRLKYIISAYSVNIVQEQPAVLNGSPDLDGESEVIKLTDSRSARSSKKSVSRATTPSSMVHSTTSLAKSRSAFGRCRSTSLQNSQFHQGNLINTDQAEIDALKLAIQERDEEILRLRSLKEEQLSPSLQAFDTTSELTAQKEKVRLLTLAANEQELEIDKLKAEIKRLTADNSALLKEVETYGDDMDILRETQEKLRTIESTIETRDSSIAEVEDKLRILTIENDKLRAISKQCEAQLQATQLLLAQASSREYSQILAKKDNEIERLIALLETVDINTVQSELTAMTIGVTNPVLKRVVDAYVSTDLLVEPLQDPPGFLSYELAAYEVSNSLAEHTVEKISDIYDVLDDVVQEYVTRVSKTLETETQDDIVLRLPDPMCYDIYDELERDLRAELARTKEALAKATDLLEEGGETLGHTDRPKSSIRYPPLSSSKDAHIIHIVSRHATPEPSDSGNTFESLPTKKFHESPLPSERPAVPHSMSGILLAKDAEISRLQDLLTLMVDHGLDNNAAKSSPDQHPHPSEDIDSLVIENMALSNEVDILNLSISIQNNVISTIADHYIKKYPTTESGDPTVSLLEGKILSLTEQLAQADGQVTQLMAEVHATGVSRASSSQRPASVFLPRSHPLSEYRSSSVLRTSLGEEKVLPNNSFDAFPVATSSSLDQLANGLIKPSVAPIVTAILRSSEQSTYEPLKNPTALMEAIMTGNMRAIGANLQQIGYSLEDGTTALMLAAEYNVPAAVKYLAEFEAGKTRSDGKRAIDIALQFDHLKVATLLLNWEGLDVSVYSSEGNRKTELMTAAANGDVYTVFNLLGLQGKLQDSEGRTALMYACEVGNVACARLLLIEKGIRDNQGNDALFYVSKDLPSHCILSSLLSSRSV